MTGPVSPADPALKPSVLVIEDGHEYITVLERFLSGAFGFTRAGDGPEALSLLDARRFDAIFLDMRFDRAERLLGDLPALAVRFGGDMGRARRFLENNQGTFILSALREAGCGLPVVFSHDFDGAPRRFANLARRHGSLRYVSDAAGPAEIERTLMAACRNG